MALRDYDENKKKRTRAAFVDFRSKVERTCKMLDGIASWDERLELCTELVRDLPNLLDSAGGLIEKATMNELTDMLEFAKVYKQSPTTACLKLITHIDGVIKHIDAAYAPISQDGGGAQSFHDPSAISLKIIAITVAVAAVGVGAYFGLSQSPEQEYVPPADVEPPELGPLLPITQEATSKSGAIVTFSVSAYDDEDGQVAAYCDPGSGSMFPIGKTKVNCSANDSNGNTANGSFIVSVVSDNKPKIDVPSPITQEATSKSGAIVTFGVSAYDDEDGSVQAFCTHESGSMFPIGKTKVNCKAYDSDENNVDGSFIINVVDTTPPEIQPFQPTEGERDASGVVVYYGVTAYDVVDGEVGVSCDHVSGTKFPIGSTIVTCFAEDSNGNKATRKLEITVSKVSK